MTRAEAEQTYRERFRDLEGREPSDEMVALFLAERERAVQRGPQMARAK